MSRQLIRYASALVALATSAVASAQIYGSNGCSSCGTAASYAPPISTVSNCAPIAQCTPIQPVYSACYQTVPVTTYKREKQTVEVPEYYTDYEEQDVTTYVPVSTTREVEVPTVSYRTVTENRTVTRDMGRWQTNYQPIQKCAPCQVDPRPGMMGWLNRTGYAFRSALTPNYRTSRQYVPKMMACTVPYSRQVAVRGTRKVAVQETRMVAKTTKQRVAVQRVRMKTRTVEVARPVTAYRTVPIGTTLAYGGYGGTMAYGGMGSTLAYGGYGYGLSPSSIAFLPDDEDDDFRSARRPEADPAFEGDRTESARRERPDKERPFNPSAFERELPEEPLSPLEQPGKKTFQEDVPEFGDFNTQREVQRPNYARQTRAHRPIARSGWTSSRSSLARRDLETQSSGLRIPKVADNRQ